MKKRIKDSTLSDFINECRLINPDFDFYDYRYGNHVRNIYEALDEYKNKVQDEDIIIPYNFEKKGRGRSNTLKCNVKYDDCESHYDTFQQTIKENQIDLTKNKRLLELNTKPLK